MSPTITTTPDAVERVAWAHRVPIERDGLLMSCTFAGVTYRAELEA